MIPQKIRIACTVPATTKKNYAATHGQRLSPVTPLPNSECGIRDKDHKQEKAKLANQHPGIGDPLGDNDPCTEERNVSQSGDLPIVEIRGVKKIEDQRQRPYAAGCPGQPQPPGPQIEPHESDQGHE